MEEITVPASVTAIGDSAFESCKALARVMFQEGSQLTKIARNCFQRSGLEEFQVPPGVTEIQLGAFSGCKRLRRVTLNENLEILEEGRDGNDRGRGVFEDSGI